MDDRLDIKLDELRQRIAKGDYRVDPRAVAEAIVRRRWSVAMAPQSSAPASEDRIGAQVRRVSRTRELVSTHDLAA